MTDETKPEVIQPAETDDQAFEALMSAVDTGGISEIAYRLLRSPVLFDPSQARANAKAIATALRKAANQLCDATRPPGQPRVRELYSIHGEAAGVWWCEHCKLACRTEEEATECCTPRVCKKCSTPFKDRSYTCSPCWAEDAIAKAAVRWANAEPIEADAYTGVMVYAETIDGSDYGHGYYADLEALGEYVDDQVYEGTEKPTLYVYATTPQRLSFDVQDLLENQLEEFHEDAESEISSEAKDELQVFLDQWADKYSPTTYYQDTTKKIIGWESYIPANEESEQDDE